MSVVTDLFSNATSDSPSAPPQINTWQPASTKPADTLFYNTTSGQLNNNPWTQNAPSYQNYLNSVMNNPYNAGYQTAANAAGTGYTNTGNQAIENSGMMSAAAQNMLAAGNQVWNTANDPLSAIYNRTMTNDTDRINAQLAASGISPGSGYGANLAAGAMTNANMDWQNNLLSRQSTGLSGLNTGTAGAASAAGAAGNLGASGAQSLLAGGSVPQGAYSTVDASKLNALNNYTGAMGTASGDYNQQSLADLLSYLGLGASQSNAQAGLTQQGWQNQNAYTSANNAQNASMWGGIGNLADIGLSFL